MNMTEAITTANRRISCINVGLKYMNEHEGSPTQREIDAEEAKGMRIERDVLKTFIDAFQSIKSVESLERFTPTTEYDECMCDDYCGGHGYGAMESARQYDKKTRKIVSEGNGRYLLRDDVLNLLTIK